MMNSNNLDEVFSLEEIAIRIAVAYVMIVRIIEHLNRNGDI